MIRKTQVALLGLCLCLLLAACDTDLSKPNSDLPQISEDQQNTERSEVDVFNAEKITLSEGILDNPSYYRPLYSGHDLAESEGGYYALMDQLLFYIDKESKEAVLLSAENESASELRANSLKKEKSDAFFPEGSDLFFVNGKLYVFTSEGLFTLPAEGGLRTSLASIAGYRRACFSENSFIVEQNQLNEKGDTVTSFVEVSLDGQVKDFYHFSSMLNDGRFLTVQKLFPYQDKIYVHSLVRDPEHPEEAEKGEFLTIIDKKNMHSKDIKLEFGSGEESYGLQFLNVYLDQLAMTLVKQVDQRKKPDAKLVFFSLDGERKKDAEDLPWPQVFLSNGVEAALVPSPVTWISKSYEAGPELSENKKQDLLIQDGDGKHLVTIDDALLQRGKTARILMANNGQILIKDEGDLLILVDGQTWTRVSLE